MKTAVVIMVGIVIFTCVQHHVESAARIRCGYCNKSLCRQVGCRCDGHMDECNCCTICFKCRGESCYRYDIRSCTPGTTCQGPLGPNVLQAYYMDGKCL